MNPDKKQLEILLIGYFRKCYDEFPKGRIVPSESPDFLLRMKNKRILGIELTRLNPGNALVPDEDGLQEIARREIIIKTAREVFERNVSMNLFVKFLFSEDKKIVPAREIAVSAQLAGAIRNAVGKRKGGSFFRKSIPARDLPEGVEEVLVIHHPKLERPVWERSNNLGVSNNVVDDIRNAIRKKDEKLLLYRKQRLNYYWLLITTDRLRGVRSFNLADKIMNHRFDSMFQHVFLFDLVKADVYRLV